MSEHLEKNETAIQPSYELTEHQYLSDLSLVENILSHDRNKHYVITSPTNSGKTRAVIKALQKSGARFVFAVDCKLLAMQLHKNYGIPLYYAGLEPPKGSCITLYNHVHKFADRDTVLIVDEFHSLVKDYSFKQEVIESVIGSFNLYRQVIGLTGTLIGTYDDFRYIQVNKKRDERMIQLFSYKNYIDYLAHQIITNKDKTHYISLFSKDSDTLEIISTLAKCGIPKEKIACINSDTKDTPAFKQLVNEEKIEGYHVILTTYTQGFNIKGTGYMLHIIPKDGAWHSVEDIEQVVNRFRDETPAINLYWQHEDGYVSLLDVQELNKELQYKVDDIKRYFDKYEIDFNDKNVNKSQLLKLHADQNMYNLVQRAYTVSHSARHHLIHKGITTEIYKCNSLMNTALKEYGYRLFSFSKDVQVDAAESDERIKEVLAQHKKESLLHELSILHETSFQDLKQQSKLSERYMHLLNYVNRDEAYQLLHNILLDKKSWTKLLTELNIINPQNSADKKLLKIVYSTFKVGESYTSEEIDTLFKEINRKVDIDVYGVTKTKNTLLLKNYFVIRSKRTKKTMQLITGKRVVNAYYIDKKRSDDLNLLMDRFNPLKQSNQIALNDDDTTLNA